MSIGECHLFGNHDSALFSSSRKGVIGDDGRPANYSRNFDQGCSGALERDLLSARRAISFCDLTSAGSRTARVAGLRPDRECGQGRLRFGSRPLLILQAGRVETNGILKVLEEAVPAVKDNPQCLE